MDAKQPFKWRYFESETILRCVLGYFRYPVRYFQLEEMMLERGLSIDHSTIYRWVQAYALELEKRFSSLDKIRNSGIVLKRLPQKLLIENGRSENLKTTTYTSRSLWQ